jgi:spermidine synthase
VARFVVLAATFACAACGLVYELALVTLGSYLIGNTTQQASVVLGVMVFAMGIGSLAAKRLSRVAVPAFVLIEGVLAVAGGLSVLVLYAAFAWLDLYQPALVAVALVVGGLIGAEIPVLVAIVQRTRVQPASDTVADLFAADYIGALVGGLAFPFLLLPRFGQLQGALAVGVLNVAAAAVVTAVFRRELARRARAVVAAVLVAALGVLATAALLAGPLEVSARQALYDDPIVHAERTPHQEIALTESRGFSAPPDLRLFLNGDLQFSSLDEYRYHEALVHPAMAGRRSKVAILGGGDGLALREVLRYPDVERVVEVELDPGMVRLARQDERLRLSTPRPCATHGSRSSPRTPSRGSAIRASTSTWSSPTFRTPTRRPQRSSTRSSSTA